MATIDTYKIKIEVDGDQQLKTAQTDTLKLGKNLQGLQDQADKTDQAFQTLGNTIDRAAKFAGAALGTLIFTAGRMADEMVDLGEATGTSAGFVRALALSLEQAGGKFDGAGKVLINFYKSLDEVANLNEDTTKAFMELGITLDDLKNKTNIEIFSLVVDKLREMGAGFQQTALGIKIFGKEFASINPDALAKALDTKDFTALEDEMMKTAAAIGVLEANFRALQEAALRFVTALFDISGGVDGVRLSTDQADKIVKALAITFGLAFGASTLANIIKIGQAIKVMAASAALLGKNPVFRALALGGLAIGGAIAGKSLFEDEPASDTTAGGASQATTSANKQSVVAVIRAAKEKEIADNLQRQFELQNKQAQIAQEYQNLINGTANLSKQEADRKKVEYEIDKQLQTQLAEINAKITAEQEKKSYANKEAIKAYVAQKEALTAQAAEQKKISLEALKNAEAERAKTVELQKQLGIMQQQSQVDMAALQTEQMRKVIAGEITQNDAKNVLDIAKIREEGALKVKQLEAQIASEKDNIRKTDLQNQIDAIKTATDFAISEKRREVAEKQALEESYAAGVTQAISQIADGFKPYKMAQDAVAQTWGKIGSAVDQFVETGKFKFSDFARSVIQDLAKMIIKAQIFKAIQATLGLFGFSIPGLATGGPAQAGQPYIVGEKGPELFVPKNAGTVIPNNQLGQGKANAMATGAVNAPVTNNYITNNISAVDAKSVAQLFAENRKSLLGASEMARKEMAYA